MTNVGYFIGGLFVGGAVFGTGAWLLTKRYCSIKNEESVKKMSDEMNRMSNLLLEKDRPLNNPSKLIENKKVNETEEKLEEMSREAYVAAARTVSEIQNAKKTDYGAFYDEHENKTGVSGADMTSFIRDTSKSDEDEEDDDDAEPGIDDIHSKSDLNSDPVVISSDEAGDIPGTYSSEALYYYTKNDILVDDFDEVIDEPEKVVGNLLHSTGFDSNSNKIMYVKNARLCTIYEIQKVENEWKGKGGE